MPTPAPRDDNARLGRALFYVLQQGAVVGNPVLLARTATLMAAGRAMEFAVRLQGHGSARLSPDVIDGFAELSGLGPVELRALHLPMLKRAGVVEYQLTDGRITRLEEYVGLSAPMLRQALAVLDAMGCTPVERALLHSVEIASWAPLTRSQHLQQLVSRGVTDEDADSAAGLALALGVNARVSSATLREDVVFNPNVWASGQEDVAKFLRGLPAGERDALLGMCAQASSRPGLAVPGHQVGARRLTGGLPSSALWRR